MCKKCKGIRGTRRKNAMDGLEPALYTGAGAVLASALGQVVDAVSPITSPLVTPGVQIAAGLLTMTMKGSKSTQLGLGMAAKGIISLQEQYIPLPNLAASLNGLPSGYRHVALDTGGGVPMNRRQMARQAVTVE